MPIRPLGFKASGCPKARRSVSTSWGQITVTVGFSLEGQGQYTLVAQLVADFFGVDMATVRVAYADTDVAPPHFGPGGSRLGVSITGAVLGACRKIEEKFKLVTARLMQCEPAALELADGFVRIIGVPRRRNAHRAASGNHAGAQ